MKLSTKIALAVLIATLAFLTLPVRLLILAVIISFVFFFLRGLK